MIFNLNSRFGRASALALSLGMLAPTFAAAQQAPMAKIVTSSPSTGNNAAPANAPANAPAMPRVVKPSSSTPVAKATKVNVGDVRPTTMTQAGNWAEEHKVMTIALLKANNPTEVDPRTGRLLTAKDLLGVLKQWVKEDQPKHAFEYFAGPWAGTKSVVAVFGYDGVLIDVVPFDPDLVGNAVSEAVDDYERYGLPAASQTSSMLRIIKPPAQDNE